MKTNQKDAIATAIRVEEWRTVALQRTPYDAPETCPVAISGRVPPGADPRKPEGSPITTSPIAAIEGRIVTTRSGTRYLLGRIDKGFRAWLREHRPEWNHREPIAIGKVRQ